MEERIEKLVMAHLNYMSDISNYMSIFTSAFSTAISEIECDETSVAELVNLMQEINSSMKKKVQGKDGISSSPEQTIQTISEVEGYLSGLLASTSTLKEVFKDEGLQRKIDFSENTLKFGFEKMDILARTYLVNISEDKLDEYFETMPEDQQDFNIGMCKRVLDSSEKEDIYLEQLLKRLEIRKMNKEASKDAENETQKNK